MKKKRVGLVWLPPRQQGTIVIRMTFSKVKKEKKVHT